jgi:hypothetical protein
VFGGKMKVIENGFKSYQALVIPKDAPEVQVIECRRAFYAGAAILLTSMMNIMDEDREPTANDMMKMAGIQAELDAFGAELDKQILKPGEH